VENNNGDCEADSSDPCTQSVKVQCASQQRQPCSVGSTACGDCLSGYVELLTGSECVMDPCGANEIAVCQNQTRTDCVGTGGTVCGDCLVDFYEDANTDFCLPDPCNTEAQTVCASLSRQSCASGVSQECGACLNQYEEDSQGICIAKLLCSDWMGVCAVGATLVDRAWTKRCSSTGDGCDDLCCETALCSEMTTAMESVIPKGAIRMRYAFQAACGTVGYDALYEALVKDSGGTDEQVQIIAHCCEVMADGNRRRRAAETEKTIVYVDFLPIPGGLSPETMKKNIENGGDSMLAAAGSASPTFEAEQVTGDVPDTGKEEGTPAWQYVVFALLGCLGAALLVGGLYKLKKNREELHRYKTDPMTVEEAEDREGGGKAEGQTQTAEHPVEMFEIGPVEKEI